MGKLHIYILDILAYVYPASDRFIIPWLHHRNNWFLYDDAVSWSPPLRGHVVSDMHGAVHEEDEGLYQRIP